MSETYIEQIIRETAEKYQMTPADLVAIRGIPSMTPIRDEAIKRIRNETQLSLPTIAKIFGLNVSSVWDAVHSTPRVKTINADAKIAELWPDHDLHEIAVLVSMSAEGVRAVGRRLGLGRPFRHVKVPHSGHRAFTPRCAEILREHGIEL